MPEARKQADAANLRECCERVVAGVGIISPTTCPECGNRLAVRNRRWAVVGESATIAYADPPYPGCAYLYKDHPDYAGEVDHVELVRNLQAFDGWALSTSSKALHYVLGLCPGDVRVLVWVKNTVRYAWEPVIVKPARRPDDNVRDWIHVEPEMYQWRPKPAEYVIGQKPEPFCMWLFSWLGAQPGDEFIDLFPGSGAVGLAWGKYTSSLSLAGAPTARSSKRAARRALREHPTILGDAT